ncbi:MAG: alginate export family protein [Micavibrio sp.]|nr:alginate export family protein [Micavibrio sp.]
MINSFYRISGLLALILACTAPAFANEAEDSLIKKGAFYGDIRYRYETVDQDGPAPIADDATASTLRARLGFKTGVYKDFQAQFETDLVGRLGDEDYNDGKNGKTQFPVIADPATAELNQLWILWSGLPQTTVKAGRQTINFDNQRFIGSVGWRQNDQTFDAAAIENKSIENLALSYTYARTVNRVFGHEHPQGDWDSNTHLAHASYVFAPWLNITGYGYWLDFNIAPASSNKTYGLRLTGDIPLNDAWTFFYEAEGAKQYDNGNNPANYNENYYLLAPGIKGHGLTLQAGFESLGGDGTNAFQTPLATLHAFNGWADKFLTTPATGLEDAYGKVSYKISRLNEWLDDTTLTAVYHDFSGDSGSDYGSELDLSVGKSFELPDAGQPFKAVDVLFKYADYEADDAPFTDTQKAWIQIGVKF